MTQDANQSPTLPKRMSMIVTKGTLDWAYPPFILATTAASLGHEVSLFFTFYGLGLLKKDVSHLKISTLGNPAMEMPMMGLHLQMPNFIAMLPGVDAMTSAMMKNLIQRKGIASIAELREAALEAGVRFIGCQMTLDLFEMKASDLIDGIELAGAATYIDVASGSNINLYI
jgi:peroxiredoxin family protein